MPKKRLTRSQLAKQLAKYYRGKKDLYRVITSHVSHFVMTIS